MKTSYIKHLLAIVVSISLTNCSTDNETKIEDVSNDTNLLSGCTNVVIHNGHAYAACGEQLQITALGSETINTIAINGDDIAVDTSNNTLFVQSRNTIQALNLSNPLRPTVVASSATNFGLFSGIDAANGIIVVSAGTGGSNTQVYRFSNNQFNLVQNGIPTVDNVTGNPDVHVAETASGARAFYSQDLGAVANWGIQIIDFNTQGNITNIEPVVTLTAQRFTGGFNSISPANFPLESEFLNNKLYVAHFAVNGIEVVDLENNNTTSTINLGYQPVNITTNGNALFAVGTTSNTVSIINPSDNTVNIITENRIEQARSIAANENYLAIADRIAGLLIIDIEN